MFQMWMYSPLLEIVQKPVAVQGMWSQDRFENEYRHALIQTTSDDLVSRNSSYHIHKEIIFIIGITKTIGYILLSNRMGDDAQDKGCYGKEGQSIQT